MKRRVEIGFHALSDPRATEAEADGAQRSIRHHVPILARDKLVPRQEAPRELRTLGRQELIRIVQRVAREELMTGGEVTIDLALDEVLRQLLLKRERELREASPNDWTVRPGGAAGDPSS